MFSIEEFNDADMRNWILQQLPAVFNQTEDSNNQALLNIIADRLLAAVHDSLRIYQDSNLEYASGKELDTIGADWGVDRIDADDDFMRFLIRLARIKNQLGVTENDLIDLISYTLGADPSEFTVETRLDKVGEVQAISIANIPNKYNNSERKTKLLSKYIQECVAAEVRVLGIVYQQAINSDLYVVGFSRPYINFKIPTNVDMQVTSYDISSDVKVNATQITTTNYTISEERSE